MCEIILLADDEEEFLETWTEYLEDAGYEVIQARSPDQARRALLEGRVHLALLDIRLTDKNNDDDTSGLDLARETAGDNIPKIILTHHETYQYVQQALSPLPDGRQPAVLFLSKAEGPQAMLAAVRTALDRHQSFNRALKLVFNTRQPLLSLASLVMQIESELDQDLIPDRIGEFKDLLRKLFTEPVEQVTVQQLLWHDRDHLALETLAYGQGREDLVIVTCGLRRRMAAEWDSYQRVIPRGVRPGGLNVYEHKETAHYGAIAASIQRGEGVGEELKPFPAYYLNHSEKQAAQVLEKLCRATLLPWHAGERDLLEDLSLRDWYSQRAGLKPEDFTPGSWQRRLELLSRDLQRFGLPCLHLAEGRLLLELPTGRFQEMVDPFPFFCDPDRLQPAGVPLAFSLGEAPLDTLLTDRLGNAWFSDTCHAGRAPIFHDFVALEAALRFRLVEEASLTELVQLERRLGQMSRLSDPVSLPDTDPELRKLAVCVTAVRAQAAALVGQEPAPYLACLAYFCMDDLLRYEPPRRLSASEVVAHFHRLVTASMACERAEKLLGTRGGSAPAELKSTPAASHLLSIDPDNRAARIDGRDVPLSPTEYELFAFLLNHRGQVCRREDILREVFNIAPSGRDEEEDLINQNISRLRGKLQLRQDDLALIVTVRGIGFKLVDE